MNPFLLVAKKFLRSTGLLPKFYHWLNRIHPRFEGMHPSNLVAIREAMRDAIPGDYYEFGLYKGFSLWYATQMAAAMERKDMRFFGFDSFDGLPEPKGVDREPDASGNTFARGCFCAGQELVEYYLRFYGADMKRVTLVKGFFEDTLTQDLVKKHSMGKAAIVLIDCDMYSSTKTVLGFLPFVLQPGTILLFDDWLLTDSAKGQQLATREWLAANPWVVLDEYCSFQGGQGFRVRMRERTAAS
jgi:hypothetical protein